MSRIEGQKADLCVREKLCSVSKSTEPLLDDKIFQSLSAGLSELRSQRGKHLMREPSRGGVNSASGKGGAASTLLNQLLTPKPDMLGFGVVCASVHPSALCFFLLECERLMRHPQQYEDDWTTACALEVDGGKDIQIMPQ